MLRARRRRQDLPGGRVRRRRSSRRCGTSAFGVEPGEVVSLIGESGSGKSTIGRMILRLTSVSSGVIAFDGTDISVLKGARAARTTTAASRACSRIRSAPATRSSRSTACSTRSSTLLRRDRRDGVGRARRRPRWSRSASMAGDRCSTSTRTSSPAASSSGCSSRGRCCSTSGSWSPTRSSACSTPRPASTSSTSWRDLKARGLGVLFVTHDLSLGNYISDRTIVLRRGAGRRDG